MRHQALFVLWLAALATGCASTGAVPRPFPGAPVVSARPPATTPPAATPPVTSPTGVDPIVVDPLAAEPAQPLAGAPVADPAVLPGTVPAAPGIAAFTAQVIGTALGLRGTPYRYGGSDPSGFDCSGFVQWVYAQHGLPLPREVREQYYVGATIETAALRPGDLVFFETEGRGASHVGIVIDDESFVHAPNSRGVVRVERLALDYWSRRYLGARRLTE